MPGDAGRGRYLDRGTRDDSSHSQHHDLLLQERNQSVRIHNALKDSVFFPLFFFSPVDSIFRDEILMMLSQMCETEKKMENGHGTKKDTYENLSKYTLIMLDFRNY